MKKHNAIDEEIRRRKIRAKTIDSIFLAIDIVLILLFYSFLGFLLYKFKLQESSGS